MAKTIAVARNGAGARPRRRTRAGALVPYLLLAPAYALVTLVLVYPAIENVLLSLWSWRITSPARGVFVGLENYRRLLLEDPEFWPVLGFTAAFTVSTIALEFLLGLGTALLLSGLGRGRRVLTPFVLLPYMIPAVVVGLVWRLLWTKDYGLVNFLLGRVGIRPVLWLGEPFAAGVAVVVSEVWRSTPFVTLVLLAGLAALPLEPHEAAAVDGASRWQAFRHVTLPLLLPSITVALLFQTIFKLRVFDLIFILTGGGPGIATLPLGILVYRQYFRYFEGGYAAALAVIVLLIGAAVSTVYLRLMYREVEAA